MADTLVILPTYNEIQNLDPVLGRVRQSVPQADVLIVDDASPDGTGKRADELAAQDSMVSVLHRRRKEGLGRAYLDAFEYALARGYVYVAQIDADGSFDPADLPAMLMQAQSDADLVIGSRWVPGGTVRNWPWLRKAISRGGNGYARKVLGSGIRDLTSGYRVIRTEALKNLQLDGVASQGYCFQVEVAWRLEKSGHKVHEHPVAFIERVTGRSKMHVGIVLEALLRVTWWGIARAAARRKL